MAPLSSEPTYMVVILNPARRKALYHLIGEIAAYMRSQIDLEEEGNGHAAMDTPQSKIPEPQATVEAGVETSMKTQAIASGPPSHITSDAELISLRESALVHFDEWKEDVLSELNKVLFVEDDENILDERKKREERMSRLKKDIPSEFEYSSIQRKYQATSNAAQDWTNAVETLQAIYYPIPTRLATLPVQDRMEVISANLLFLLSTGNYSSYSRALIAYLTSALELPLFVLNQEEKEIVKILIKASSKVDKAQEGGSITVEAEPQERRHQNRASRFWAVSLASAAGVTIIGVTGGLAAPIIAGAVGLSGVASFLGTFWTNDALVGKLFGAFGARMTGNLTQKYAREVQDFRFLPLKNEGVTEVNNNDIGVRRLRVTIGISGWLMSEDEVTKPWYALGDDTESFALSYETESLLKLGRALQDMATSNAWGNTKIEIFQRTVLATLKTALWPIHILKSAAGIDNPYDLAKTRSEKTGRILADALISKVQGERPVTLVGYSLGSRAIYFCLKTLAERRAFGLVDTVVFIGAPTPACGSHWRMIRSVVSGKMFNVFSRDDYTLAFLDRATSTHVGIAGLQAVEGVEGLVNIDASAEVKEHLRYPELIAPVLNKCGFPDLSEGAGGQSTPSEEEMQPVSTVVTDKERNPVDTGDQANTSDITIEPVAVKPLSKRFHREISFPSGISRTEKRPVVRKVQSVPISGSPPRRSSPLKGEALAGPSSLGASHVDDDSEPVSMTASVYFRQRDIRATKVGQVLSLAYDVMSASASNFRLDKIVNAQV